MIRSLKKGEIDMNIFYIIGVIVVILAIAGYFGLR
jgi:LPXTG-motif cell wall-anchored protein